jgi:hypothetical protein
MIISAPNSYMYTEILLTLIDPIGASASKSGTIANWIARF